MSELEQRLTTLAQALEWPPEPELRARVRSRLDEPAAPLLPWRRTLVLAFAVLAVAVAAAFAVPPARTAILRWLGLEHVKVVRVDKLPPTRRLEATDLGERTTLAAARRRAGFAPLQLPGRRPDAVFVQGALGTPRVTLVYGSIKEPRLLLGEFRGVGTTKYVGKLFTGGTKVEQVRIDGEPGLWLSGAPHAVYYIEPGQPEETYLDVPLLAGNTLVWERGALTLRIEGKLDKGEAEALARSVR